MKVKHRDIGDGDAAIDTTVSHMIRLTKRDAKSPVIQGVARSLMQEHADCGDMCDIAYVRAAFRYVVDNVKYKYDHEHIHDHIKGISDSRAMGIEFMIAPKHQIAQEIFAGDCDDMTMLLGSILMAMGFDIAIKVIAHKTHQFSHVYLLVHLPQRGFWTPLDPVLGNDGLMYEKPDVIRTKEYVV